jgi:hypothetical protein
MAKKDLQSVWQMLGDVIREVSPILRWCFIAGLLGGLGVTVYLARQVPGGEWRYGLGRMVVVLGISLVMAGGFLGLVAGALLDLGVQRVRRPRPPERREKPNPWRPRRKS